MKRFIVLIIIGVILASSGCSWFRKTTQDTQQSQPKDEKLNQAFYGFPDVPVPKELKYSYERSFVFETQTLKAGIMFFSGDVDVQSLENYFKIYLIKYGWRFVNSYRYKDVILNFVKNDKTCNIKMTRSAFNTEVEIWVGPADSQGTKQNPPYDK
ncbi:MAG TPA: hypothetical protein PKW07_04085 [Syntrophorhabdaceae bacterium]|nr:hypothetical protein [Syntrophorhabdaceae bacterium]